MISYFIFTYQGEERKWKEIKMNPTPRAKILEIILGGEHQGNIHLYANGDIRVSKVKLKQSFLEQVNGKTSMMNTNGSYGFSYQTYLRILQNSLNKAIPGNKVEIREKNLAPRYQELLNKQYRMLYSPGNRKNQQ